LVLRFIQAIKVKGKNSSKMNPKENSIPKGLQIDLNVSKNNITQKKEKPRKVKLNEKNIKDLIDFHKNFKLPFTISISNYTSLFNSDLYNLHFLKKSHSKQMFAAYSKIKSGLQPLPKSVDIKYIKYYQTNFKYEQIYSDYIYQIDIKSCYPNILFNNGLISVATNEYMAEMSKENRLAAIGMLASKKNVFTFDDTGKVASHSVVKSELSDYFFFCVQET